MMVKGPPSPGVVFGGTSAKVMNTMSLIYYKYNDILKQY